MDVSMLETLADSANNLNVYAATLLREGKGTLTNWNLEDFFLNNPLGKCINMNSLTFLVSSLGASLISFPLDKLAERTGYKILNCSRKLHLAYSVFFTLLANAGAYITSEITLKSSDVGYGNIAQGSLGMFLGCYAGLRIAKIVKDRLKKRY
jgi:hypothetical protein